MKLPFKIPFLKQKEIKNETKIKKAVAGTEVSIVIYRRIGRDTPAFVSRFKATQMRDKSMNLVLINEDNEFKEDVSKIRQRVIEHLEQRMDISNLSKEKKEFTVKTKIQEQEERIKKIKDGYIMPEDVRKKYDKGEKLSEEEWQNSEKVNAIDEEVKLRNYKVLLDFVKYYDDGSYEKFNEFGEREYEFMYQDGIVYPILFTRNTNTNYVDMASNRKIHKDTSDDINREFLEETTSPFHNIFGKIMWFIVIGMIIGNVAWSVQLHNNSMEFNKIVDESRLTQVLEDSIGAYAFCNKAYQTLVRDNSQLINYATNEIINKSENNEELEINDKTKIEKTIDLTKRLLGEG